jgi:hypothetical protein
LSRQIGALEIEVYITALSDGLFCFLLWAFRRRVSLFTLLALILQKTVTENIHVKSKIIPKSSRTSFLSALSFSSSSAESGSCTYAVCGEE